MSFEMIQMRNDFERNNRKMEIRFALKQIKHGRVKMSAASLFLTETHANIIIGNSQGAFGDRIRSRMMQVLMNDRRSDFNTLHPTFMTEVAALDSK